MVWGELLYEGRRMLSAVQRTVGALSHRPVVVRALVAADLVAIGFAERWANPTWDDLGPQSAGQISVYVAWLAGAAVGVGFVNWLRPRHPELAERFPNTPEIFRLWVEPGIRSSGVGSRLMAEMEIEIAGRGFDSVGVGVHAGNHRALALYERLGYADADAPFTDCFDTPDATGRVQHVEEPSVFLVKPLSRTGATH